MKYIKNREIFLTGIKEFNDSTYNKHPLVVREAFSNDIAWGDSLVGRLISHIVRKAKIKANLMRMDGVIRELRQAMEDILKYSVVGGFDEDLKKKYVRFLLFTFLDELNGSIVNGYKIGMIKNITESTIDNIETGGEGDEISDEAFGAAPLAKFDGRDELLKLLKDFQKKLDEFKDNTEGKDDPSIDEKDLEGAEDPSGEEEESDEENEEEIEETEDVNKEDEIKKGLVWSETIKTNFSQVYSILCNYDILTKENIPGEKIPVGKAEKPVEIKPGQPQANKPEMKTPGIAPGSKSTAKPAQKVNDSLQQSDDILFEALKDIDPQFVKAIKPLHSYFKGKGFKFPTDSKLRAAEFTSLLDSNKDGIVRLYKAITLLKENTVTDLLASDRDLSKNIMNFYKFTKEKKTGDVKGFEKSKMLIDGFNKTMTEILKSSLETDKKKESKFKEGDSVSWENKKGKRVFGKILKVEGDKYLAKTKTGKEFLKKETELRKEDSSESENVEVKIEVGKFYSYTNKEGKTRKVKVISVTKDMGQGDDKKWFTDDDEEKKSLPKDVVQVIYPDEDGNYDGQSKTNRRPVGVFKDQLKPIKESTLKKYYQFLELINEADEGEEIGKDNEEKPESITKIQEYWKVVWTFVQEKKYSMERTEYDSIRKDLEEGMKGGQKEGIQIQGIDPIIRVVKCFNRAYKLHTTPVIPSGRSGGKVSNAKFMEYTSFGGGSPDTAGASGGPYRNNKLFDKWEDAVLDIKGEAKFQPIFAKTTTLKNLNGDLVKDAGQNLGKFMIQLLDGDELYKGSDKGGTKGAQAKFLDEFFSYKVEQPNKLGFSDDVEKNQDTSSAVVDATKTLKFTKEAFDIKSPKDLVGTFFVGKTIKGDDGKEHTYYFFVHYENSGKLYVSYTKAFRFYHSIIQKTGQFGNPNFGEIKKTVTDLGMKMPDSILREGGEYEIRATLIPFSFFKNGVLESGIKYTTKCVRKKAPAGKEKEKFKNSFTDTEVVTEARIGKFQAVAQLGFSESKDSKEIKILQLKDFSRFLGGDKPIFPEIQRVKDITTAVVTKV